MTARFWILITVIVAVVAGAVFVIPRLEGEPPVISELPSLELGAAPRSLVVDVADEDSGLRAVSLRVLTSAGSKTLVERHFPGSLTSGGGARSERIEVSLDVGQLGLPDGEATLVVVARDWSLREGLAGNSAEVSTSLTVDTEPPSVRSHGGLTYVYRGGSAAVTYTLGEPTPRDGVRVGEVFFRGYGVGGDGSLDRIAIFAIPVESEADPLVRIVAQDAAGNETSEAFALRIFERQFTDNTITLSQSFLDDKVVPLAEANGLTGSTLAESFKNVNETLREQNEARIREVVEESAHEPHWQGAFEQIRNSAVTSRFAEKRTYWFDERPVSKAIHYGFDLASTRGATVTAANSGTVVLAEDLGIYGRCVVIDHGLGVHSLYGHLSELDVAEGDSVTKGEGLGRSGSTGLAGGDHLHFAMLVDGEYVDPLEWWDPKWVRSHIEARLQAVQDPG